jgi:hypothetical protein
MLHSSWSFLRLAAFVGQAILPAAAFSGGAALSSNPSFYFAALDASCGAGLNPAADC